MSIENSIYLRNTIVELLRKELPVLRAKARISQEDIAEKSKINYQVDEYGFLPQYRIRLLNTSKKLIPSKLIYIGNFADAIPPRIEFIPHSKDNISAVFWKKFDETFETKMIKQYCGHNLRELNIYMNAGN